MSDLLQDDSTLLRGQQRVLEMVATDAPLPDTLQSLIALIEAQEPDLRCGISIVAEDGNHFGRSYGPNLPDEYQARLAVLSVTPPYLGPCAEVAHRGIPIALPNIAAEIRYSETWRKRMASYGLAAMRSTPVFGPDGVVLAAFAMYYDRPRAPNPANPRLIEIATHLAAIALERAREREAARAREDRLRGNAATFSGLIRNSPFGIYVIDADFRFAEASHSAREAFGIDCLIGADLAAALRKMWPDPFATEAIGRFQNTLATGVPYVARNTVERRADIEAIEAYDWRIERITMPDGRFGVVCYFYDLSERQRIEFALRASEARFAALFEQAPSFMAMLGGPEHVIEIANPGYLKLVGNRPLIGRTVADALPDAVAQGYLELLDRVYRTGHPYAASGAKYVVQATPDSPPNQRYFDFVYQPITNTAGTVTGIFVEGTDVTDRVEAQARLTKAEAALARDKVELERLVEERTRDLQAVQSQLAHAQRMEALGQLAGGIAHDFNNALQAVQGGAGLIERRSTDPESVRRLARMVLDAVERGAAITRRLLAFSRRGDLRAEAVDPVSLLTDMREILVHTLGGGIGVRMEAPPGLPPFLADKGQVETVLVNIATNARDAMSACGSLTLAAGMEVVRRDDEPGHKVGLKSGSYVCLSVSDTGAGMTPEVLARVTEPFFTTKEHGKGTGLGLAMARGFAEQSGGGFHIDSVLGQGTTVRLWFPLAESTRIAPPASGDEEVLPGHAKSARLLVVDDEPLVREVIVEQMEASGYDVLSVGSGAEALAALDAGEIISLIISDLSMPGMDGVTLVREAQRRRPRMPAILLTGFATSAAEIAVGGVVGGPFSLLRKPISEQQLAERVAMLLEAGAA